MSSLEDKQLALALYAELGDERDVVEVLGFPHPLVLKRWIKRGDTPANALSFAELYERYQRRSQVEVRKKHCAYGQDVKDRARVLFEEGRSFQTVATMLGVSSRQVVHRWIHPNRKEEPMTGRKPVNPTRVDDSDGACNGSDVELREQLRLLQIENDVLRGVVDVLKVGGLKKLTNAEKTRVINHLRRTTDHRLNELTNFVKISKSSYNYQRNAQVRPDKYAHLREVIRKEFAADPRGYRVIIARLRQRQTPLMLSEKVVRRIMHQEHLVAKCLRRKFRKFRSYQGEISPAPDNLVLRDFHADEPSRKWLTDITEFRLPSSEKKVYLSPILDCWDGYLPAWAISTRPDERLANRMLKQAITSLPEGCNPVIHSDRGAHYRWPEWISICDRAGLQQSRSKKSCTPDNAAMEGFFSRLKNEFFYSTNWAGVTANEFIARLDAWLRYYNEGRIQQNLGWQSPAQYRQSIELAA